MTTVSALHAAVGAVAATVFWTCVGVWPARRLTSMPTLALAIAPALGWAIQNAAAFPVLLLTGFSAVTVAVVAIGAVSVSAVAFRSADCAPWTFASARLSAWSASLAAVAAVAPAIAIVPKPKGNGVLLAPAIFDHAKIAIVNEIARSGLPVANPFFCEFGAGSRLAYYYLWHFGAAQLALLTGIGGWEAEVSATWFTAFSSLLLMMGFAVHLSARSSAAVWVVALSLAASLRPVLNVVLGAHRMSELLSPYPGLGAWIIQATWVPQHLASACCVVLSVFVMVRLAQRCEPLLIPVLALLVAAGFASSAWVGGVTFAAAGPAAAAALLFSAEAERRLRFAGSVAVAALLAAAFASPFLYDQFLATAARGDGSPIMFHPYEVLGTATPRAIRRILDLPAYWLVLLPVELPALWLAGFIGLARVAREVTWRASWSIAFAVLAIVSLAVSWLFTSTIGNNDLGWRSILPGLMVLTLFAACGLARWKKGSQVQMSAAILCFVFGLPAGLQQMRENAFGDSSASAADFAQSDALWRTVRRYASPDDRVGNNPLYLSDMTAWPVNISWALQSDRRSCFAGWETVRAYSSLSRSRATEIDAQFIRIFNGEGSADDVRDIAILYGCRVIALTAADGAWTHDPFALSPYYRLVERDKRGWRIYAAVDGSTATEGSHRDETRRPAATPPQ